MAQAGKAKARKPVARKPKIHNLAEVDWEFLAGHLGGAFP